MHDQNCFSVCLRIIYVYMLYVITDGTGVGYFNKILSFKAAGHILVEAVLTPLTPFRHAIRYGHK